LDVFLGTCAKLQPTVDIKTIIVSMVERLSAFAVQHQESLPAGVNVFNIFSEKVAELVEVTKCCPQLCVHLTHPKATP